MAVSQKRREIGPKLLLITNKKSYTGFRLPLNSMTFYDLERQNRSFYGFLGDFRLRDTFQKRIAPKPIEIDIDKLRMKFSALNVDCDGPSLDFYVRQQNVSCVLAII